METESQATIAATTDNAATNRTLNAANFDWRQDLLSAADSVTDAMSSLVLEYNGGIHSSFISKSSGP